MFDPGMLYLSEISPDHSVWSFRFTIHGTRAHDKEEKRSFQVDMILRWKNRRYGSQSFLFILKEIYNMLP